MDIQTQGCLHTIQRFSAKFPRLAGIWQKNRIVWTSRKLGQTSTQQQGSSSLMAGQIKVTSSTCSGKKAATRPAKAPPILCPTTWSGCLAKPAASRICRRRELCHRAGCASRRESENLFRKLGVDSLHGWLEAFFKPVRCLPFIQLVNKVK